MISQTPKPLPCPYCGHATPRIHHDVGYWVSCITEKCADGPIKSTEAEAVGEWNRVAGIVQAARGLVEYRKRNTLNFQLEKADDFIRMMRNGLEGK